MDRPVSYARDTLPLEYTRRMSCKNIRAGEGKFTLKNEQACQLCRAGKTSFRVVVALGYAEMAARHTNRRERREPSCSQMKSAVSLHVHVDSALGEIGEYSCLVDYSSSHLVGEQMSHETDTRSCPLTASSSRPLHLWPSTYSTRESVYKLT